MNHLSSNQRPRFPWPLITTLATFVCLLWGCAGAPPPAAEAPAALVATAPGLKTIQGIALVESQNSQQLHITSDANLEFTAIKRPDPPAILFFFPATRSTAKAPMPTAGAGNISRVTIEEATTPDAPLQLMVEMVADTPYDIDQVAGNLVISVPKPGASRTAAPATDATPALTDSALPEGQPAAPLRLSSVTTESMPTATRVQVRSSRPIERFDSFTLANPPRIVFDIYGLTPPAGGEQVMPVNTSQLSQIRYFGQDRQTRLVLDTETSYLSRYRAETNAEGLQITINNHETAPPPVTVESMRYGPRRDGPVEVRVRTSQTANYRVTRPNPDLVRLHLQNSRLAADADRSLPARAVVGAVKSRQNTAEPTETWVDVHLNRRVPYLVDQNQNLLTLTFETSGRNAPAADATASGTPPTAPGPPADDKFVAESTPPETAMASKADAGAPTYTGEKLILNFHDTDIRNVFRVLADVSGDNFAVDKNVTGRVTLALEKPVPWDQVLDLVLKMNQLDKRLEGNIIRIATQETLRAEGESRTAKLKAKQLAEQQADLVTEYITINYANADKDIKTHIEAILTKNVDGSGRGTLSVDARNNILILTDVPVTIARARQIVEQLDRVTPQVLIEARIVEASSEFYRGLGISWSMFGGIPNDDPRAGIGPQRGFSMVGGTYGWDTAINFPTPDAPVAGFNFARIFGTPFLLDAQLYAREAEGDVKIISTPRVLTMDNQEAIIKQGLEYPYREGISTGGSTIDTVKFKEIELQLTVTPHITPDGRVSMRLKLQKKDIAGFTDADEFGSRVPFLNTKEAETEFLMENGDTIVIGGIKKTRERVDEAGLPWLSKIPILGWLFKNRIDDNTKEELLIFITPQILQLQQQKIKASPASGSTF